MFKKLFGAKKQKNKDVINDKGDKNLFVSPLNGELLDLKDVPDQVFSQKIMGDGFAIKPENGEIVSPVNGEIVTLFPTKHAIGIQGDNGREILIHIGVDTVNLEGEGFKSLIKQGDRVEAGQTIMKVDIDKIQSKVPSIITPVVFTNLSENERVSFEAGKKVEAGEENIITIVA
ncbi:hypothetical protein SH2C18_47020 [Clostridium sediminicola]|uniref:PTS sugar transporter subunit IIA n=1 Tax=Clostridium sediminicola TaxID=3114879 RepID=UPI0031F253EE